MLLRKEGDWLLAYPPSKHSRAIAETLVLLRKEGDWLLAYPPSKHFRAIAEGGGLAFGLSPF